MAAVGPSSGAAGGGGGGGLGRVGERPSAVVRYEPYSPLLAPHRQYSVQQFIEFESNRNRSSIAFASTPVPPRDGESVHSFLPQPASRRPQQEQQPLQTSAPPVSSLYRQQQQQQQLVAAQQLALPHPPRQPVWQQPVIPQQQQLVMQQQRPPMQQQRPPQANESRPLPWQPPILQQAPIQHQAPAAPPPLQVREPISAPDDDDGQLFSHRRWQYRQSLVLGDEPERERCQGLLPLQHAVVQHNFRGRKNDLQRLEELLRQLRRKHRWLTQCEQLALLLGHSPEQRERAFLPILQHFRELEERQLQTEMDEALRRWGQATMTMPPPPTTMGDDVQSALRTTDFRPVNSDDDVVSGPLQLMIGLLAARTNTRAVAFLAATAGLGNLAGQRDGSSARLTSDAARTAEQAASMRSSVDARTEATTSSRWEGHHANTSGRTAPAPPPPPQGPAVTWPHAAAAASAVRSATSRRDGDDTEMDRD